MVLVSVVKICFNTWNIFTRFNELIHRQSPELPPHGCMYWNLSKET